MNAQTGFPLSVLTSSPAQLNPASTGLFNAEFRAHAYFKSQVARSLSGGIKGTGLAVDYKFSDVNMALGVVVFSNTFNRSALRDFNFLLSYGYHVELNDQNMISFGVQGGFKQVGFSLNDLNFGSQYDPAYQGGYNPNLQPGYINQGNTSNLDVSTGVYWQGYLGPFLALRMGAAGFHLVPMKTDFLTDEAYLKPKYVLSANARYEGDFLHWIPSAMYVTQNNRSYAEIGTIVQLRSADKFVNAGLFYRTPNVIIPTIGVGLDKLTINLSMEYYIRTNFSQIFNIGVSYVPQTNRRANLMQDFYGI
jgi:type IX secretion system PorP/SprF family membrane protein